MKDIFGREIVPGALVAVSRQVGYSVGQYAGTVVEVSVDDYKPEKVRVKYSQTVWGAPEKPQWVGRDKVVVINEDGRSD